MWKKWSMPMLSIQSISSDLLISEINLFKFIMTQNAMWFSSPQVGNCTVALERASAALDGLHKGILAGKETLC